jgi:hypothetical protein
MPKVEDLTENSRVCGIEPAPDGQVFVSLSGAALRFSATFQRMGWQTNTVDRISQERYFQPSNDLSWVVGYNDVFLVKGAQEVVRRVSRRSDGRWLEYTDSASVAPDGSLAVASRSQSSEIAINIYSSTGEPISTFQTPFKGYIGFLAYNGRHVFVRNDDSVLIFNTDGTVVGKAALPAQAVAPDWAGPFIAAGGREIWLVELGKLKVFRFAAPQEK